MTVLKKSVSFDEEVARRIETAAEEDGLPFSTWRALAAEKQLLLRDGLRAVAEWEAEAGCLTTAERAAGEALLSRLLGDARSRGADAPEAQAS
ncbi:MAG: hypothetical protein LBQ06_05090 [Frankiaceae bacterium]|jgi:hypothetical protein|nr:hypothetical protein [Frankiaceae bacterium]